MYTYGVYSFYYIKYNVIVKMVASWYMYTYMHAFVVKVEDC